MPTIEPLPHAMSSQIIGLLEALHDRGGRDDIYKLAKELNLELGDLMAAIRGAELLEFATTPGGDVELTDLGKKLLRARTPGKKKLFLAQMKKGPLFSQLHQLLEQAPGKRLDKERVLEELSKWLPDEDAAQLFETAINWARYSELFGFDQDTGDCFLPEE
ncbi:MAG TPA: AAA-associated domain-containing protein [Nitrospiria bacterium]|nr:AAA-associated domain-containing protein [Nitrospiria bacterium]